MNLVGPYNSGTAAGGAGVATANTDYATKIQGTVVAVYIDYKGTAPPATTDVTITSKGTAPHAPAQTILKAVNLNTDGWFYPRALVHVNTTGVATAIYNNGMPVYDSINVLIAQGDDDNNVDVWLLVE